MFNVMLETNDPNDSDFLAYCLAHGITVEPTGKVHAQPGGGIDTVYRAATRKALETLIADYFVGGDDEADAKLYEAIAAIAGSFCPVFPTVALPKR
jgi:hypothetical protein